MDSIKNFFSQIDGRIFDFSFANFSNKDYLFNSKPADFYFQSWAFVLSLLGVIAMVLVFLFLKKRRNIFYIERGKRHILNFHTKIALVLISVIFVLVFFRSQGMMYVSMRFIFWFFVALIAINKLMALVRIIIYKPVDEVASEIKTDDTYQKYLPKKKK
jgi:hypothetical protein